MGHDGVAKASVTVTGLVSHIRWAELEQRDRLHARPRWSAAACGRTSTSGTWWTARTRRHSPATAPRSARSGCGVAAELGALMQQIINPIAVELDDTARLMRIRWDDGHLGEWRWTTLRRACPCALCSGEGNMPGIVTLEMVFTEQQTTMERVKWIGRYALAPDLGRWPRHGPLHLHEAARAVRVRGAPSRMTSAALRVHAGARRRWRPRLGAHRGCAGPRRGGAAPGTGGGHQHRRDRGGGDRGRAAARARWSAWRASSRYRATCDGRAARALRPTAGARAPATDRRRPADRGAASPFGGLRLRPGRGTSRGHHLGTAPRRSGAEHCRPARLPADDRGRRRVVRCRSVGVGAGRASPGASRPRR